MIDVAEPYRELKAPFPWFGGKRRVANIVWPRLGDVTNYVEPFAGSLAMLLARPHYPFTGTARAETVNDASGWISNFWRAIKQKPDEVAAWCDWPVNEADLHARHQWLVDRGQELLAQLIADPEYCDAKMAGWWVWGISQWIGGEFCAQRERCHRRRPHLGNFGQGTHKSVAAAGCAEWFGLLSERLRRVRVCCGDWSRVVTKGATDCGATVGIFLDPPYSAESGREKELYDTEGLTVAHDVRRWCLENGDNPRYRIALCGYSNEHEMPSTWEAVGWSSTGGISKAGQRGNSARHLETIWFSPHCLRPDEGRDLWANE